MEIKNTYVPGVCNIGPEEVTLRVRAGWIGLIVSVVLGLALVYSGVPPVFRIFVFLPLFVSSLGFLQAAFHFCVAFGMQGVYNVMNAAGKTESVSQQEFRKKDQAKVVQIFAYSLVISAVLTVIVVYL